MKVCKSISLIKEELNSNFIDKKIALVPTMGALHEGHLSLIRTAKKYTDTVCVSIFVNPTQFSPNEDFNAYPRTLQKDLDLLEKEGVSLVFTPNSDDMYVDNQTSIINPKLSSILCGKSRPIHFSGVLTVVNKLFNIVKPTYAVFGKKDYQQLKIIEKMVVDLNMDVKIIPSEIIREDSGLAKSSRNSYLSDSEKEEASLIYKSLTKVKESFLNEGIKNIEKLKNIFIQNISTSNLLKVEYVEILDKNLSSIENIEDFGIILVAVHLGKTRLIDNMELFK